MLDHQKQLAEFVHQLALFLVENQTAKGISLAMERPTMPVLWAYEWSKLRNSSPIFGYPTVEEAEKQLKEFLRILDPQPSKIEIQVTDGNQRPTTS